MSANSYTENILKIFGTILSGYSGGYCQDISEIFSEYVELDTYIRL